jgi:hypothetical protein
VAANQAIGRVGAGGTINLAGHAGAVHVIVDVQGWFSDGEAPGGSRFNPIAPARVADTRSGAGLPLGRIPGGTTRNLDVTGVGGVPATGVSAVVVNLTAVGATTGTHLTAWASGGQRPTSSNVNVAVGQVAANQAIVPVGANGMISIANAAGATHVVVDVQGWFGEDGLLLQTTTPTRIADSRPGGINIGPERFGSGATFAVGPLQVPGAAGPTTTAAAVLNITAVGALAPGHLTAWAYGQPKPATSNVNFATGQVVANQAFVPVGGIHKWVNVSSATGATYVIVDVLGWFVPYV